MVKSALVALIIGLYSATTLRAQDYLFTWHGDSNYFHASFEVTSDDMMPGTNFESDLFYNSLSITNPLGQTYFSHTYDYPYGSYIPWSLGVHLYDWQRYTRLDVDGGPFLGATRPMPGIIAESNQGYPYNTVWFEQGYWSVSQIPEPSVLALLVFGLVIFIARRRSA
jgi:hypothetical protein